MSRFIFLCLLLVGVAASSPTADALPQGCFHHFGGGCGVVFQPIESTPGWGVAWTICNGDLIDVAFGRGYCPYYTTV